MEIEIGVVGKPHGLRGEMRVFFHNPTSELLGTLTEVSVVSPQGGERETWSVRRLGPAKKGVRILSAPEVADRDAASARRGWKLVVPRSALPALEEGEFYYHEVPGYRVETESGRQVGTVRRVVNTTIDVLEVERLDGGEWLVPVVGHYVLAIDRTGRRVVVAEEIEDWIEGV